MYKRQALIILIPAVVYTVRPGDTLASIAASYGTTPIVLMQNNPNLLFSPVIQPGQQLTIRFEGDKIREVTINAYAYPYIRRDVLRRGLPYLTYLTIFGYGFTVEGELIPIDDQPLINLAYEYKTAPVMLDVYKRQIPVTRLAYGIPVGGDLEYADEITLRRSLEGRSRID